MISLDRNDYTLRNNTYKIKLYCITNEDSTFSGIFTTHKKEDILDIPKIKGVFTGTRFDEKIIIELLGQELPVHSIYEFAGKETDINDGAIVTGASGQRKNTIVSNGWTLGRNIQKSCTKCGTTGTNFDAEGNCTCTLCGQVYNKYSGEIFEAGEIKVS